MYIINQSLFGNKVEKHSINWLLLQGTHPPPLNAAMAKSPKTLSCLFLDKNSNPK